jgi:hypothetical protein
MTVLISRISMQKQYRVLISGSGLGVILAAASLFAGMNWFVALLSGGAVIGFAIWASTLFQASSEVTQKSTESTLTSPSLYR